MKKLGKYFGWALLAVVAMVIVWYLFFRKKAIAAEVPGSGSSQVENDGFPLKKGSKGKRVIVLQKTLNDLQSDGQVPQSEINIPPEKLNVDGVFGSKTETMLFYYFAKKEVDADFYYNLTGEK